MGNGYSHNYGYNPFMPYGPYYGGYTPHAQFFGPKPQLVKLIFLKLKNFFSHF